MSLFDTGVRPAIDNWLLEKSKEVRSYGDYWSASQAGYCQRKVIFERLGVPHVEKDDDARKQRVFTAGHLFHDWIQNITKQAGLSIASEVELQDEDLMIRGHFDDLVLVGEKLEGMTMDEIADLYGERTGGRARTRPMGEVEEWFENEPDSYELPNGEWQIRGNKAAQPHLILYDYKTVNSRSFMWAKKNGNAMNYSHRLQLGTYMCMLRNGEGSLAPNGTRIARTRLTEARILKIEKENLMMMEQQLLWSTELESDVTTYWNSLNAHWKAKTLPKCTCADHDNGFMASEKWNPYYYDGEPCSLELYKKWKAKNAVKEV